MLQTSPHCVRIATEWVGSRLRHCRMISVCTLLAKSWDPPMHSKMYLWKIENMYSIIYSKLIHVQINYFQPSSPKKIYNLEQKVNIIIEIWKCMQLEMLRLVSPLDSTNNKLQRKVKEHPFSCPPYIASAFLQIIADGSVPKHLPFRWSSCLSGVIHLFIETV